MGGRSKKKTANLGKALGRKRGGALREGFVEGNTNYTKPKKKKTPKGGGKTGRGKTGCTLQRLPWGAQNAWEGRGNQKPAAAGDKIYSKQQRETRLSWILEVNGLIGWGGKRAQRLDRRGA